jgi:hypothetical protein
MIRKTIAYFRSIPAVYIDGTLYVLLGWFIYNQTFFGSDEAAKFISPVTLFWLNWAIGSIAIIVGSLKMFRSSSFSDHQKMKADKAANGTNVEIKTTP